VEIAALVASVVSVIVAGLAIWLSVTFYGMSSEQAQKTDSSARDIAGHVSRVEQVFDRMYSDTFSMMRDTVADMRKAVWPSQEGDVRPSEELDSKLVEVEKDMTARLAEVLERQGEADERLAGIRDQLEDIVQSAISETRRVSSETGEASVRGIITEALRDSGGRDDAHALWKAVGDHSRELQVHFAPALHGLREEGKIAYEGGDANTRPKANASVTLVAPI
jgi:hypothetical protein